VAVFGQVARPAQHGVRADQELESPQCRAGQRPEERCEDRLIRGPRLGALAAELPVQDGELVAYGKDLDVFLVVGHRQ
jgi:hypothetical protein